MKCQILFSGKNKKNISKCRLLKILPRVLSVNVSKVLKQIVTGLSMKVWTDMGTGERGLGEGNDKNVFAATILAY